MSPLQFLIWSYTAATVSLGTVYVSVWGWTLPTVSRGFWTVVALGGGVNVLIQFLGAKIASFPKGEISYATPLQAMTPLLITVVALTLGEFPSFIGVCGVLLMMGGSYVLMYSKPPTSLWHYAIPFQRVFLLFHLHRLDADERQKAIVTALALTSAFLGTFGLLFDGLFARKAGGMQGVVLGCTVLVGILAVTYILWYLVAPDGHLRTRSEDPKKERLLPSFVLTIALAYGVTWLLSVLLLQQQFTASFIAYVGALKRFGVVLAVFAGYVFFQEGDFKKRLIAALLIFVGATFISLDQIPSRLQDSIEGIL